MAKILAPVTHHWLSFRGMKHFFILRVFVWTSLSYKALLHVGTQQERIHQTRFDELLMVYSLNALWTACRQPPQGSLGFKFNRNEQSMHLTIQWHKILVDRDTVYTQKNSHMHTSIITFNWIEHYITHTCIMVKMSSASQLNHYSKFLTIIYRSEEPEHDLIWSIMVRQSK